MKNDDIKSIIKAGLKVGAEAAAFTTVPSLYIGAKIGSKFINHFLPDDSKESEYDSFFNVYESGIAHCDEGKYAEARDCFIIAMQSENEDMHNIAIENYKGATFQWYEQMEENDSGFTNYSFENRQFILIVRDIQHIAGCVDSNGVINWAFTMEDYPKDIRFSSGRPEPNTVYVAHPIIDDLYIPFSKYEETVFNEKIDELCRLSQALGATELTISSVKGRSIEEIVNSEFGVGIFGNYQEYSGSGDYRQKDSCQSSTSAKKAHERVQRFAPQYYPYCPKDLVWLDEDNSWRTMVKQRLEGNILHYSIRISSSEACKMSSNTAREVKTAFNAMVGSLNVNFDNANNFTSSELLDTVWEVSIEFEDKRNLKEHHEDSQDSESNVIPYEKDDRSNVIPYEKGDRYKPVSMPIEDVFYIEGHGVVVCGRIATGIIHVGDHLEVVGKNFKRVVKVTGVEMFRKLLSQGEAGDNVGLLLSGISKEEAQPGMVVQAISNDLTPDEEAYINEVKECSEEGEIGSREWRLLNKIRERLGISEERARELEKFVTPSLSAEEQEYIKEYKEIISDGEISARDQRFLDKLKKANGISEERAKEIESMA